MYYHEVIESFALSIFNAKRTLRSDGKKHSTFCMNNLYLLRDEAFPSFLEAFALQTSYVTRPMFLQLCSFQVSRPLVQSDGSYLRDNASEGAQESSERAAPVGIRETIIFDGWPGRVIRPVLLQSDTPRKWYEWGTEVTKMPSEAEGGGSNFERSAKQMASHSSF